MADEETPAEGAIPEEKPADEPAGETPAEPSSNRLNAAVEAIEMMRKENTRREKILEREERLAAANMLGGKSEAGQEVKQKTEEDKIQEEVEVVLDMFKD